MYRNRDYCITLTATPGVLEALEMALDLLPDAVLIGGRDSECAALVFTVRAVSPGRALTSASTLLHENGVPVPDGSSLSVLEHEAA